MANAHHNPGYGNIVSSLRRSKSAYSGAPGYPSSKAYHRGARMDLDAGVFEDIRQRAKSAWTRPDTHSTSYGDHFVDKFHDTEGVACSRPASPTRRNKPHPPLVFLTTRLHYIPGYQNPDAALGKPPYRVDSSLPTHLQQKRAHLRSKYVGRPSTAAVMAYSRPEGLEAIKDPIERQGTEAVLRIMHDDEQQEVLRGLQEARQMEADFADHEVPDSPDSEKRVTPTIIPSLHRWLKPAGAQESQKFDLMTVKQKRPDKVTQHKVDIVSQRYRDIENARHFKHNHRTKRGDFLLHPEWPPSMPHHRLNGLSSVDLPYFSGYR